MDTLKDNLVFRFIIVESINNIKINSKNDSIYEFSSKGEFFGVMHIPTKDVYIPKYIAINEVEFLKRNNYILYYCDDNGEILMISDKKNDKRIIKPEL
jgi:hypothetical protein